MRGAENRVKWKYLSLVFLLTAFWIWGGVSFSQDNSKTWKQIYSLSALEVIQLALNNNLDIQIAKFDAYLKRNNLLEANSIFDTFFTANVGYDSDKKDIPTIIFGFKRLTSDYSVRLDKKFPSGTLVSIQAYNRRQWSDSPFVTLNPNTEANVGISISHPLAKNFFGLIDRGNIKMVEIDIENFEEEVLDRIEQSLYAILGAYWKLVFVYEELRIRKDMLKEAERLYSIYKKKRKVGLVEDSDLLASGVNLYLRKNEVLQAKMLVEKAKNDLLYLLGMTNFDGEIIPTDSLDVRPVSCNLYDELSKAVETRRDYKIVRNLIRLEEINLELKKNALWPQVDLEASFTRNGIEGDYKEAWDELFTEDSQEWYIGVKIKFPIERRRERARYNEAKLEKVRAILLLKRVERLIFRDINNSVTEVNTTANSVKATKMIVRLQRRKLRAEEDRIRYGRSSSDLIIRYQEDLLHARLALVQALFSYKVARLKLERKKNTLLSKYWKGKL